MQFIELRERWNAEIKRWTNGEELTDALFRQWQLSYQGRGDGVVDLEAMPEPWIGEPTDVGSHGLVLMGLNPGPVTPQFQHRGGEFPAEIASKFGGAWSAWAASTPYLRDPWRSAVGPNPYWSAAHRFAEGWVGKALPGRAVVAFELYPWHSTKWVPSAFNPADAVIREAILEPIQSTGAAWAIGRGKAWWAALERLASLPGWRALGGLGGPGERRCPSRVEHRRWMVVRAPKGLHVVAMKLASMPVWPRHEVVADIRAELKRIAST